MSHFEFTWEAARQSDRRSKRKGRRFHKNSAHGFLGHGLKRQKSVQTRRHCKVNKLDSIDKMLAMIVKSSMLNRTFRKRHDSHTVWVRMRLMQICGNSARAWLMSCGLSTSLQVKRNTTNGDPQSTCKSDSSNAKIRQLTFPVVHQCN
jgi:hypothetical protein